MILTFDTSKFIETGLGLHDYMILLLYQQKEDYTAFDLSQLIGTTERTARVKRRNLTALGYLTKFTPQQYSITSKTKPLIAA